MAGSAARRPAFSATASLRHPAAQQRPLSRPCPPSHRGRHVLLLTRALDGTLVLDVRGRTGWLQAQEPFRGEEALAVYRIWGLQTRTPCLAGSCLVFLVDRGDSHHITGPCGAQAFEREQEHGTEEPVGTDRVLEPLTNSPAKQTASLRFSVTLG